MTRFSKFYITLFSMIWLGYGIYSLIINEPNRWTIFLFGLAFSVVFFIAVWFSEWLVKNYRRIDKVRKDMIKKDHSNSRRIKHVRTN